MESETVQMFIIGFLVTITVVGTAFFFYACCVVSGGCSRMEEEMDRLNLEKEEKIKLDISASREALDKLQRKYNSNRIK